MLQINLGLALVNVECPTVSNTSITSQKLSVLGFKVSSGARSTAGSALAPFICGFYLEPRSAMAEIERETEMTTFEGLV